MAYDFDDVLPSAARLQRRFDAVLEALEADPDWVLHRAVPGKIRLGEPQVRDYIDVAALADRFGTNWAAVTPADIDAFYDEGRPRVNVVAAQVVRQRGAPRPADSRAAANLGQYKELAPRRQSWDAVVEQCEAIADAMIEGAHG